MGGAYPYMDMNAKYGKLLLRCFTTDISTGEQRKEWSLKKKNGAIVERHSI
jgi:hypothetical protein